MAYFRDRDLSPNHCGARKLVPLGDAHTWPFASCRRFLPWYYSVLLLRGRHPVMSLPVPTAELCRAQLQRPMPNAVKMK